MTGAASCRVSGPLRAICWAVTSGKPSCPSRSIRFPEAAGRSSRETGCWLRLQTSVARPSGAASLSEMPSLGFWPPPAFRTPRASAPTNTRRLGEMKVARIGFCSCQGDGWGRRRVLSAPSRLPLPPAAPRDAHESLRPPFRRLLPRGRGLPPPSRAPPSACGEPLSRRARQQDGLRELHGQQRQQQRCGARTRSVCVGGGGNGKAEGKKGSLWRKRWAGGGWTGVDGGKGKVRPEGSAQHGRRRRNFEGL